MRAKRVQAVSNKVYQDKSFNNIIEKNFEDTMHAIHKNYEGQRYILNFYWTRVRSLEMLVSNSLTDSRLVNLIDVTLACEDANSKLVDVVTVADKDRVGNNLL